MKQTKPACKVYANAGGFPSNFFKQMFAHSLARESVETKAMEHSLLDRVLTQNLIQIAVRRFVAVVK